MGPVVVGVLVAGLKLLESVWNGSGILFACGAREKKWLIWLWERASAITVFFPLHDAGGC